jgi:hypothetical protein
MPKMRFQYKLFDSYDSILYLYVYLELVNALGYEFILIVNLRIHGYICTWQMYLQP